MIHFNGFKCLETLLFDIHMYVCVFLQDDHKLSLDEISARYGVDLTTVSHLNFDPDIFNNESDIFLIAVTFYPRAHLSHPLSFHKHLNIMELKQG